MFQNEIIIDPHCLSGEKERWTLKFEHKSFCSNFTDFNIPKEERNPTKIGVSLGQLKKEKLHL